MASKWVPFALLVGASVVNLPAIYGLVDPSLDFIARFYALYLGLLAMGLAWAAGAALEGRRRGSVRALCALGVLSPLLALVPPSRDVLGSGLFSMGACATLALAALIVDGLGSKHEGTKPRRHEAE